VKFKITRKMLMYWCNVTCDIWYLNINFHSFRIPYRGLLILAGLMPSYGRDQRRLYLYIIWQTKFTHAIANRSSDFASSQNTITVSNIRTVSKTSIIYFLGYALRLLRSSPLTDHGYNVWYMIHAVMSAQWKHEIDLRVSLVRTTFKLPHLLDGIY